MPLSFCQYILNVAILGQGKSRLPSKPSRKKKKKNEEVALTRQCSLEPRIGHENYLASNLYDPVVEEPNRIKVNTNWKLLQIDGWLDG